MLVLLNLLNAQRWGFQRVAFFLTESCNSGLVSATQLVIGTTSCAVNRRPQLQLHRHQKVTTVRENACVGANLFSVLLLCMAIRCLHAFWGLFKRFTV